LGREAHPARARLEALVSDPSWDVRIAAAEALAAIGSGERALTMLEAALREDDGFVRLAALQCASRLGAVARPLIPLITSAARPDPVHQDVADYLKRVSTYLPARLEGREAPFVSR
jgi:HEAT repeat protein